MTRVLWLLNLFRLTLLATAPWVLLGLLYLSFIIYCTPALSADIPNTAYQYQRDLTRAAHYSYGVAAPTATLAGLIHQESRWRADAVSPVGAQGIAQFMPATAQWMPEIYPVLGEAAPYDPRWSIRAAVLYTQWLHQRIKAADNCQAWAMTLSAYNGGLGWVNRDKKLALASGANPLVWFNSVEQYNAGRSAANYRENRHYPRIILNRWSLLYSNAGWGLSACHAAQSAAQP